MLYERREKFQDLSIKIGMLFSKLPLSPNAWTISSIVPALISFYFLIQRQDATSYLIAAFFFALSAFIDVIDGAVARVTGRVTVVGAYLDTITDRLIEFIIIFGLFFSAYPRVFLASKSWIFILLFGSMMTTYVKAAAFEKRIVQSELKGGILERGERLFLIFLIILVSGLPISDSLLYASYIIVLTAVLALVSATQRFIIAVKSWK